MQMPRPFVHRLRDIRIKMLEDANKEREQQLSQQNKDNQTGIPQMPVWDAGMQTGTDLDDLMDELNPT